MTIEETETQVEISVKEFAQQPKVSWKGSEVIEHIRQEEAAFYEAERYPGGIRALKEKLGISQPGLNLSSEEANQQLGKLLEEA